MEVERLGEYERYDGKIGNDMLLWHGSVILSILLFCGYVQA